MQRGESEAVIVAIEAASDLTGVDITIGALPTGISGANFVMGYIFTNATTRYPGSGGGWRSDPLFPTTSQ